MRKGVQGIRDNFVCRGEGGRGGGGSKAYFC